MPKAGDACRPASDIAEMGLLDVAPRASPSGGEEHQAQLTHQALGAIMRVRKAVYAASQGFRRPKNGCPFARPCGQSPFGELAPDVEVYSYAFST
ncbi:hypothetical protein [Phenylobacterium sp.]|uniref:hypothetical protein n=1 Tax=Phenylobacterium sp. TaxID=1871053 RepID=UPI0012286A4B|nr:hypothetical protein [Phenylobacterium sp.]THD60091.1 MAG: hypothetical protein E8A49_14930 [Phenylobacterium sp.]